MAQSTYDDSNLQQLFAELEPKRRAQALRSGFRREANQVRKTAVNNLRSSGIRSDRDLESGIRAVVFKRTAGFRITVGTKGDKMGFHTNRRGEKKPVLLWAEMGTKDRRTKNGGGKRASRHRAAHSTGRMPRYGFLAQTLENTRETVTDDIHRLVTESVIKTAKKYGCK